MCQHEIQDMKSTIIRAVIFYRIKIRAISHRIAKLSILCIYY